MSTKKETQSTIQYNPTGMAAYNSLIPQAQGTLSDFMQDPLKSTFFQNNLGIANKNILAMGAARQKNILGNLNASGLGGRALPGFAASQQAAASRATTGEQSNATTNLLNYAQQQRMAAAQTSANFQPLQTGQTTTEKTSGLGTWLPQVAGAAIGGAMNAFMPGMGGMPGGMGGGAKAAGGGIGSTGKGMSSFSSGASSFFGAPPTSNAYSYGGW